MKLEKDLYAYLWRDPNENNCNTYLIDGEITVLIDRGHTRHLNRVFHQMKEDGLSSELLLRDQEEKILRKDFHTDRAALAIIAFHCGVLVQWSMNRQESNGEAYVNMFEKIMLKGLMR